MSQYAQQCRHHKQTVITQIDDYEYIVEGSRKDSRFGFEIDPSMLTYANFSNGPFLHIKMDFLGKGTIKELQMIDSDSGYAAVRVVLFDGTSTN